MTARCVKYLATWQVLNDQLVTYGMIFVSINHPIIGVPNFDPYPYGTIGFFDLIFPKEATVGPTNFCLWNEEFRYVQGNSQPGLSWNGGYLPKWPLNGEDDD